MLGPKYLLPTFLSRVFCCSVRVTPLHQKLFMKILGPLHNTCQVKNKMGIFIIKIVLKRLFSGNELLEINKQVDTKQKFTRSKN